MRPTPSCATLLHRMNLARFPALVTLCAVLGGTSSCEDEKDLLRKGTRSGQGDVITRVRGLAGLKQQPEAVLTPRRAGDETARILIQPLTKRLTRGRFVRVLYLIDRQQVARAHQVLRAARPAPFRTCEPTWRVDLRVGDTRQILLINIPCRRLDLNGRSLAYAGEVQKVLDPLIRRAARRPAHKLLKVRVPVAHDPGPILKALTRRSVEALLPDRPPRRGPFVNMTLTMLERPPRDLSRLDQAVEDLRQRAYRRLRNYTHQLKVGRHEVLDVQGPRPVYERFSERLFEAKYAITVLFKPGTPEYLLGFLGLSNNLQVETVTHPKDYRIDVIFAGTVRYNHMRRVVGAVKLKPPITTW